MEQNDQHKLTLIHTLFNCRKDVFAIYWQKESQSGYMPAYDLDPYLYRIHKMKGGSFKNFNDKSYLTLTDHQITKHLHGEQLIGIYPLLKDNTSWFIAADFDKQNWKEECLLFLKVCVEKGIPAYLERSRSGEGGHVWIFFEKPYPAIRSRKILTTLLEQTGIFSMLDKSSSFDRLFPNQDFLSGKYLGNLIALPFHKPTLENGNSCFIDLSNNDWMPFKDQWKFLSTVQKASTSHLDSLYQSMVSNPESTKLSQDTSDKLQIILSNDLCLNRSAITSELMKFLTDELNFTNSEYFVKKKTGKSTWGTQRFFKCLEETENQVFIPRGFAGRLLRFCKQQKIDFEFHDEREKQKAINYTSKLALRSYQDIAISAASKKDFGLITAPPGSGKTVIGLRIIQDKRQPALIIVHRKQLMDQWMERIQTFLGIPKNEIGRIGQGKVKLKKDITLAIIQSLAKYVEKTEDRSFVHSFGTVIIDECHHIPADTYRNTISKLSPYYQYGLTATPFRKGNDGKLISIYLGETIAEIRTNDIEQYKHPLIVIRNTTLNIPYNSKTDTFETLSKILVHDSARNKLIIDDVIAELNRGKKVVILTERKEHIDTLNQFLKQSYETITLSGDDSKSSRKSKWKLLNDGNYQALITTGQFFGEGTDLQNASCLFLVYPFSFKGKLIQYIGRVQRSENTPVIYDYRDHQIDYLNRLFLKRNLYYRQFARQASLFDEQENSKALSKILTIAKKIKVLIDHLDFRYGAVAFNYQIPGNSVVLEFEVENDDLRPEFDVLKAFFSKILKSKYVEVEIHAEFENNTLVAQSANSKDIEKINQEIIESVKFRFIQNNIVGRKKFAGSNENLLDLHQLQSEQSDGSLYNSEEELLNDLLKNKDVKHFRHLRFLASRHESNIMKLRFVLNPFSFVFLLSGNEGYHLVLETLNTEEATYIWHFDRNIILLKQNISRIDKELNLIRNEGRQSFLESHPENFSRIIHDYSDKRKGFVIWKDMLEERLV